MSLISPRGKPELALHQPLLCRLRQPTITGCHSRIRTNRVSRVGGQEFRRAESRRCIRCYDQNNSDAAQELHVATPKVWLLLLPVMGPLHLCGPAKLFTVSISHTAKVSADTHNYILDTSTTLPAIAKPRIPIFNKDLITPSWANTSQCASSIILYCSA